MVRFRCAVCSFYRDSLLLGFRAAFERLGVQVDPRRKRGPLSKHNGLPRSAGFPLSFAEHSFSVMTVPSDITSQQANGQR